MQQPELVEILPAGADRDDFLAARRQGLGGTDVAALFGINPYKTKLGVYLDKVYEAESESDSDDQAADDDSPSEAAYWGTVLEEPVAQHFARRNGFVLKHTGVWARNGWQIASPDRFIFDGDEGPGHPLEVDGLGVPRALYEGKTASAYLEKEWDEGRVPDHYVVQIQWYLAVTGLSHAHVGALVGGQRYVQAEIERDQQLIDGMLEVAAAFWWDNIQAQIPPSLIGEPADAALALIKELHPVSLEGSRIDLGDDFFDLVAARSWHQAYAKAHGDAAKALEVAIREQLGDYEEAWVGGQKVIKATNIAASTFTVNRKPSRRLYPDRSTKPDVVALELPPTTLKEIEA